MLIMGLEEVDDRVRRSYDSGLLVALSKRGMVMTVSNVLVYAQMDVG